MSPTRLYSLKTFNIKIATRKFMNGSTPSKALKISKTNRPICLERFPERPESALMNNLRQPYKSFLVFFVGRSHCAEAVVNLKEMAFRLSRLIVRQCKVHASQKLQQSLQFYSFYSRMWGDEMTRKMISGFRRSLLLQGKYLVLSAACLLPYDWDNKKISDQTLERSVEELNSVEKLCSATVCCQNCNMRLVIDKKLPDIDYCSCNGSTGYTSAKQLYESWEPFLERENILVWRKPNENYPQLYAYKVYGTYDDMSLSAFMEAQLNTEFRTDWDSTALELKVLSSHPETNSDLIYWRVKFPQFFANRDYVFKRRFKINEEKKEVMIISELAEHEQVPAVPGLHRVCDYWSIMVLRATHDFNKPGMSYTLTYFDNPGTNLPAVVTSFIATTAFPDYLKRVYSAAMNLQHRWENGEDVYIALPHKLRHRRPSSVETPSIFSPDTIWRDVELFDIDHDKFDVEERDPRFKAIGDALTNDKNIENESTIKMKYKNVVIDLLEAMEVTSPDLEEKTKLSLKIEKLVDMLQLENTKKILLLNKLREIRLKTKRFLESSSKKKEESIDSMKKFKVERSYYDNVDERTIFLIKGLFKAINEVMEMDKDMRTGKGLKSSVNASTIFSENLILKSFNNASDGTKSKHNDENGNIAENCDVSNEKQSNKLDPQLNNKEDCPCCACDKTEVNNNHWYSIFVISSWWGSNSTSIDSNFCDNCVCDHKPTKKSFSSNKHSNSYGGSCEVSNESVPPSNYEVISTKAKIDNDTYWNYLYFWSFNFNWLSFYMWPFSSNSSNNVDGGEVKNSNVVPVTNSDSVNPSLLNETETESNVSWYWIPVKVSYDLIAWVFGSKTAKEPG